MKTQKYTGKLTLAATVLAVLAPAQAQMALPWAVDIRSSNNGTTGSPLADKLYLQESLGAVTGNRVPSGYSFWLVIDGGNNGVNFASALPGATFNIDTLLQPDDVLYKTTTIPPAGRISRTVLNIPPDLRQSSNPSDAGYSMSKPMWGLLFNEADVQSGKPGDPGYNPAFDGAKFGAWYFGSKSIPELGNAIAVVTDPLYADRYNFVPVPEPATTALFAGTLLGVGAIIRRVRRNRQEAAN